MKEFFNKYKHGLLGLYVFIYLAWYFIIESIDYPDSTLIHCIIDDYIPFCEFFIIPYILWFFYILGTAVFMFFLSEKDEFYMLGSSLILGMSFCMIIYSIWPNHLELRPESLSGTNIFARMVLALYSIDTSTNVCPSVHVYTSIMVCIALFRNPIIKRNKYLNPANVVLCILICLSTMFIKQHSFVDVVLAALLSIIMYILCYLVFPALVKKCIKSQ